MNYNTIEWVDFKTAVKGKEEKIKEIETKINNGQLIEDGNYDFGNIDKHLMWAIFLSFVCGFGKPILSASDTKKLKGTGMFLNYRSFIFIYILSLLPQEL